MLLQTLNPWQQLSSMMNCHFSATLNQLGSASQSAAEDFPLCSHTTCGMYLTELELGLPGQLMPLNHSTIHSTPCCPVLTLLLESLEAQQNQTRSRMLRISRGDTFKVSAINRRRNERIMNLISHYTLSNTMDFLRDIGYNYLI